MRKQCPELSDDAREPSVGSLHVQGLENLKIEVAEVKDDRITPKASIADPTPQAQSGNPTEQRNVPHPKEMARQRLKDVRGKIAAGLRLIKSAVVQLFGGGRVAPLPPAAGKPEESGGDPVVPEHIPPKSTAAVTSTPDQALLARWGEHCEKIEQLQLVELTIGSGETVETSRTMQLLEELYTLNLIPDEDFYSILQRMPMSRSGMANLFQPPPDILKHYPEGYETVRDQVFADLAGRSGHPGKYRCFALHRNNNPHDSLVAYLTLRQPPLGDEREVRRYIDHLTNVHREKDDAGRDRMTFDAGFKRSIFNKQYPSMVELDTINAHPDPHWAGAGRWLIYRVLQKLDEEEFGQNPVFYYRLSGFRTLAPAVADLPAFGRNDPSARLLGGCGFDDYATRCEEGEVVVRDVPNAGIVKVQPRWKYGYQGKIEGANEYAENYWSAFLRAPSKRWLLAQSS